MQLTNLWIQLIVKVERIDKAEVFALLTIFGKI